ncbi:MAG TPA: type I-A CRISPR-associated protein Cas7/Csa2 [Thermoprotei archaeon]|nr:type I-A CRISPR-associated protein Cas7/Csa2 [Thermoprotei archaeon]
MFVSVRGRLLINVEALNMTESVGNYVKHRRVPVILPKTYATYFVPAISGESIAHGFQNLLASQAIRNGIKVCKLCERGIFLKSTNEEVFKDAFNTNVVPKDNFTFEKFVINNCLVEDVGGFLYAPRAGGNVKRTSNFYTGYMIPVNEALENTVIEPQLHSRYALGTKFVRRGAVGQMIYYVEISSAVYTFSFDIDTNYIGKTTFVQEKAGTLVVNDREKRVKVTLEALKEFLSEILFGANKTRFLPVMDWESLVIAVADNTWTIPSPASANYINNSLIKAEKTGKELTLYIYINPEILAGTGQYIKKKTEELIDTMKKVIEEWKKNIQEKMPEYSSKIDWDSIVKEKLESLISKRLEEITQSTDMRYISTVEEKYSKVSKIIKEKGMENVKLYDNLISCISDAINDAENRIS